MLDALSHFIANDKFYRYITLSILMTAFIFGCFYIFSGILIPFLGGILGAYLLSSAVRFLESLHIPRSVGSGFMVLSVIIGIFIVISMIVPSLQKELSGMITRLPKILTSLEKLIVPLAEKFGGYLAPDDLASFKQQFASYIGDMFKWFANIIVNLLSQGMVIANVLSITILTPIIMYYILRDWPFFIKVCKSLIPQAYERQTTKMVLSIHTVLRAYLKGQGFICLVLMVLYSLALTLVGMPQSFLVGFLTGALSFVPYLGGITGICLSFALLVPQTETWHLLGRVLIVYGVLSLLEGKVLIPRLIGKRVGLHPVWMLFALLAGAHIFGFWGLMFAVPIAVVIITVIRFFRSYPALEV